MNISSDQHKQLYISPLHWWYHMFTWIYCKWNNFGYCHHTIMVIQLYQKSISFFRWLKIRVSFFYHSNNLSTKYNSQPKPIAITTNTIVTKSVYRLFASIRVEICFNWFCWHWYKVILHVDRVNMRLSVDPCHSIFILALI